MFPTRRAAAAGLIAGVAGGLLPAFAAGSNTPLPPKPDDTTDRIKAFEDDGDHLTAPVWLNGQGPFDFLVDTGANVSCVSQALAQALNLRQGQPQPVHTMAGVRTQPIVLIDELQVGGRRRRDVMASALRLDDPKLDGVLAVDWLGGQRLTLDFVNGRLELAASRTEESSFGRVVVPARRRLGQLTIVDAELGDRRVSAMIDSGSQISLCNGPLAALQDRTERAGGPSAIRMSVRLFSILGEPVVGELIDLPRLRIGGLRIGNVPVVRTDAHAFEIWGLANTPAVLLGMDLLRQFRAVSLDFGRSQVRFDLPPGSA